MSYPVFSQTAQMTVEMVNEVGEVNAETVNGDNDRDTGNLDMDALTMRQLGVLLDLSRRQIMRLLSQRPTPIPSYRAGSTFTAPRLFRASEVIAWIDAGHWTRKPGRKPKPGAKPRKRP